MSSVATTATSTDDVPGGESNNKRTHLLQGRALHFSSRIERLTSVVGNQLDDASSLLIKQGLLKSASLSRAQCNLPEKTITVQASLATQLPNSSFSLIGAIESVAFVIKIYFHTVWELAEEQKNETSTSIWHGVVISQGFKVENKKKRLETFRGRREGQRLGNKFIGLIQKRRWTTLIRRERCHDKLAEQLRRSSIWAKRKE